MTAQPEKVDDHPISIPAAPSAAPTLNQSSGKDSRAIVSAERRNNYLERIVRGEQPAIIIVSGQAGSGKTTLLKRLEALGVQATTRLMPRARRADDLPADREWTHNTNRSNEGQAVDLHGIDRIFFADHKYAGYYGFPTRDLVSLVKAGTMPALIVGRSVEVPAVIEGCRSIFPLAPIVPIRLDVPLQILADRLYGRPVAHPGELEERLSLLELMNRDDRTQFSHLQSLYGQRMLFHLSDHDLTRLGYHKDQICSVDEHSTLKYVSHFLDEAKARSKTIALDILRERSLNYGHRWIPDALIDVLDNVLLPACQRHNFVPCIKGGLAVALYLEQARKVSADIDFTVPLSESGAKQIRAALSELSGSELEYKESWEKPVYHVRGINTAVKSPKFGELVELDALHHTYLQPRNQGFCYDFTYDAHDHFMRREVTLPSGQTVALIPPEQIIIEKLAAGRGAELGKFDLFDAGSMLTLPFDTVSARKIIDSQRYDRARDPELFGASKSLKTDEVLDLLEIRTPYLRELALGISTTLSPETQAPSGERQLNRDVLKRLALVDQLLCSLSRIASELHTAVKVDANEVTTLAKRYPESALRSAVDRLQQFLVYYASYELGRLDVFARRPLNGADRRKEFFSKLSEQQQKFSKRGA